MAIATGTRIVVIAGMKIRGVAGVIIIGGASMSIAIWGGGGGGSVGINDED